MERSCPPHFQRPASNCPILQSPPTLNAKWTWKKNGKESIRSAASGLGLFKSWRATTSAASWEYSGFSLVSHSPKIGHYLRRENIIDPGWDCVCWKRGVFPQQSLWKTLWGNIPTQSEPASLSLHLLDQALKHISDKGSLFRIGIAHYAKFSQREPHFWLHYHRLKIPFIFYSHSGCKQQMCLCGAHLNEISNILAQIWFKTEDVWKNLLRTFLFS